MPPRKPHADTRLTRFLEKRILELRPIKTQAQIASEAGFTNFNMLSMIKSGATRLPLDRVSALAKALGVDPARLLQLALEQQLGSAAARAIETIFRSVVTRHEADWINEIRAASGNTDPPVTTRTRSMVRSIFGK